MSTGIFIKTYENDIPWLEYCLRSVRKYAIGIDEIVIVADGSEDHRLLRIAEEFDVHFVDPWQNGYIQQQYWKMQADKFIESENVLFVDSDVIFHDFFSENSFMIGRSPILLKTRYGNLAGAESWKAVTERAVRWPVDWEYMRRMPLIYRKDSITAFRNATFPLIDNLQFMKDRSFSEFNALGAFIDRYESDKYRIFNTEEWMPEPVAKQFWSWGGISSEIRIEMEGMIRNPSAEQRIEKLRSRDNLSRVLRSMGLKTGVEIGVAFGENAECLLSDGWVEDLLLVDPWDYVPGQSAVGYGDMIKDWNGCEKYCLDKLHRFAGRFEIMKTTSTEAAKKVEDGSKDFVYIDANHMSPWIDEDLKLWFPKVRSGGLFGGHDYHDYQNSVYTCNVKSAVDRFFSGTDLQIHVVPGEVPSWFVVKG